MHFLYIRNLIFFIKPWSISVIAYYCFVLDKITKYIQDCFIKSIHFFVNNFIGKCFSPIKSINHSSDKFDVCIFVMPHLSIIL